MYKYSYCLKCLPNPNFCCCFVFVLFYRHLRNVSIEGDNNKPRLEFTADGVLKAAELKIMNLRRGDNKQLVWEEVSSQFSFIFILPISFS